MKYTEQQLVSACMTHRHDFGVLPKHEKDNIRRAMAQILQHLPEPAPVPGPMPDRLEVARGLYIADSGQAPGAADFSAPAGYVRMADRAIELCAGRLPAAVWGLVDELGRLQRDETDAANSLRDSVSLAEFAARAWAFGESKRLLEAALKSTGQQWPKVEGLPTREEIAQGLRRADLSGRGVPDHDPCWKKSPGAGAFRMADYALSLLARRPATDEAEALRCEWQEEASPSHGNPRNNPKRMVRDLKAQLAQVTMERDEALERVFKLERERDNDAWRKKAYRERDEAVAKLAGVEGLLQKTDAQATELAAEVTGLREQLAARPEAVVIDEALADSLARKIFSPSEGDNAHPARVKLVLMSLRTVIGDRASVSVPQGEPQPHPGPFTPEREAELRRKPAYYCVHELFPVLDGLRTELATARQKLDLLEAGPDDYTPEQSLQFSLERRHAAELERARAELEQERANHNSNVEALRRVNADGRTRHDSLREAIKRVDTKLMNLGNEAAGEAMKREEFNYERGCYAGRNYAYAQTGPILREEPAIAEVLKPHGWQHTSSDGDAHTFRHSVTGEERTLEGFPTAQDAAWALDEPAPADEPVQHPPPESAMVEPPVPASLQPLTARVERLEYAVEQLGGGYYLHLSGPTTDRSKP